MKLFATLNQRFTNRMLSASTFLLVLSLGFHTLASPLPNQNGDIVVRATTTASTASITLPTNDSGTELPSPDATLKYVALGRGTQNYSCTAASAVPTAIGAVATLYDITSLLAADPSQATTITSKAVDLPENAWFFSTLKVLGHHFFSAAGVPTFVLSAVGDVFYGTKTASVAAPADADPGPAGTGAVAWLQLTDAGGSVGITEVYRVETAGGNAPSSCPSAGVITVEYAAEYYFFG
jgi:hypothetical protein